MGKISPTFPHGKTLYLSNRFATNWADGWDSRARLSFHVCIYLDATLSWQTRFKNDSSLSSSKHNRRTQSLLQGTQGKVRVYQVDAIFIHISYTLLFLPFHLRTTLHFLSIHLDFRNSNSRSHSRQFYATLPPFPVRVHAFILTDCGVKVFISSRHTVAPPTFP